mgnify:CR=1 FL=1
MQKLTLGLVIAAPVKDNIFLEAEKYASADVDILLFPEGYITYDMIDRLKDLARDSRKWIVAGVDDTRDAVKKQAAVIIDADGNIVGEHIKSSVTSWEAERGYAGGDSIQVIDTPLGKIGLAICYELHFPEVARILALQGAEIIFNQIGTGMWNETQFSVWNSIARTRAFENLVFVAGVSHYSDAIPLAFAYAPNGDCLISIRGENRLIKVVLDPEKYPKNRKLLDRRPELYKGIAEA